MSSPTVKPLDLATRWHVSTGKTMYVLHCCGMQISVPAAGKSEQNIGSLLE